MREPDPPLLVPHGRLRPWRVEDASTLVEAWHDAEVSRWNPVPADPSDERARDWIEGCPERLRRGRSLDLCIVDDDDLVVGEVGLSGFDPAHGGAFIGYWLLPRARGRGTCAAAVSEVSEWALDQLGLRALVARCATANLASHAVARSAGYAHAGRDSDHELYVRRRSDTG